MMELTGGKGYDDVFVYAPVKSVVEMGGISSLPVTAPLISLPDLQTPLFLQSSIFNNVHYGSTHIVGTSGGNTDDMIEAIGMMEKGLINPAAMITHVGGLNTVIDTVINLPEIKGGKKLIYTNKDMPLVAIADFEERGKTEPFYADLAEICKRNNNLWCLDAEKYVLENAKDI